MTSILPSDSMRKLLAERTRVYAEQLEDAPDALDYLVSQRGLSKDLVSRLQLGYVADPIPGDRQYKGRISIPFVQPAGVTWMKFRAIDDDPQKYHAVSGLSTRIYNTPVLLTATQIVITEGEFDTMSFLEAGIDAVAIPGATNWKKPYNRIFRNRRITIFCDGDEPGREFGKKLQSQLYDARIIEAPDGEDANSILTSHGPQKLKEMIYG